MKVLQSNVVQPWSKCYTLTWMKFIRWTRNQILHSNVRQPIIKWYSLMRDPLYRTIFRAETLDIDSQIVRFSVRYEDAVEVWNGEQVRTSFLLDRTRYYGEEYESMGCKIISFISRCKISLYGYGIYARWRSGQSYVPIWRPRFVVYSVHPTRCPPTQFIVREF